MDNGAPLKLALNLTYSPTRGDHEIRLVYLLTEDSDGDFQCPDDQDNSLIGALFRIKTMALVRDIAVGKRQTLTMHIPCLHLFMLFCRCFLDDPMCYRRASEKTVSKPPKTYLSNIR